MLSIFDGTRRNFQSSITFLLALGDKKKKRRRESDKLECAGFLGCESISIKSTRAAHTKNVLEMRFQVDEL
jgi:hypothetical protein